MPAPLPYICVIGHPSKLGGADTELDHQIRVWQALGIEVYLLHTGVIDRNLVNMRMEDRGVKYLQPRDWSGCRDMVVISYCNGEFLKHLPEIRKYARKILWVNCMTWLFPLEKEAHARGDIDLFIYQTDHARRKVQDTLTAVNPAYPWAKVRPYFHAEDFPFTATRPDDKFRFGRVSRDDPSKFSKYQMAVYRQMYAPVLKEGRILGFSDRVKSRIGDAPDWITTYPAGGVPAQDIYRNSDCIIQACDTYENLPRVGFEAMASGSLLIVDDRGGWQEEVIHKETGFLCKTEKEFVYYSTRAAFEPEERRRMTDNARQHLLDNWGMDRAKKEWAEVLGAL